MQRAVRMLRESAADKAAAVVLRILRSPEERSMQRAVSGPPESAAVRTRKSGRSKYPAEPYTRKAERKPRESDSDYRDLMMRAL